VRSAVDEFEHQITDGLQVLAALSGVDGAVVLTDRLRLVGFGAELRASARLSGIYRARDSLAQERETISPESFGTRHRSAFRFCAQHARGCAFVHSQDGGMRAVKRIGEDVVYWDMDPVND
jgi:DNA integrity scanning protein DisA with diadenylate cyclase activity